ncbi:tetratricopeptide repeat protein [Mycobacterium sp. GA-2829]|uniref:tetratricopeptide repeat protein n=1 Tax=Mycobacterium sp. GA-2829 TaxID=1772283 RepID=UPI00074014E0|nr:tetratricopeptide repeat protein [Mycobacterium sp. GA-2829]KUI38546.1 Mce protein [Mycobacterium sp. GA-2829]
MADDAPAPDGEPIATVDDETAVEPADAAPIVAPAGRSPVRTVLIAGLALVVVLAGVTGWFGYRAYQANQDSKERELYLQVGRQAAQNLTSIDWQQADADVQRVLDVATGTFYDDFQKRAEPFLQVVKEAKSKSVGTLGEAGLESVSDGKAEVLVAVTVQSSNAGAPEQAPRAWRMRLTVERVDDGAKVSQVEFVQ